MSPAGLILSRDGSMSLTKLAASTFHLLMALTVGSITVARLVRYIDNGTAEFDAPVFDVTMWSLYAAVAVGHAVADKTSAQVAAFKQAKLEHSTGNGGL